MLWTKGSHRMYAQKLTEFLMSFLKLQATFRLNFASLFSVVVHNYSEMFWLKHYMLWTKETNKSTIFQTFEGSNGSSPNSLCHFCAR